MSIGTIGGILLILGAFFVYKGEIFKSVFVFFLADIIWSSLAFQAGDIIGFVMIWIGMLFGLGAFYKMHKGTFRKSIKINKNS